MERILTTMVNIVTLVTSPIWIIPFLVYIICKEGIKGFITGKWSIWDNS